jgi:hypothetical protein
MDRRTIALLSVLAALLVVLVVRPLHTETRTVTRSVTLPYTERSIQSSEIPVGEQRVTQEGRNGAAELLTYYDETLLFSRRLSYKPARADGRPTRRIVVQPQERILEIGGKRGDLVEVPANAQEGRLLGTIGRSGHLRVSATGTTAFKDGTVAGPEGDPSYKWAETPRRPDLPVGALLFRVGDSPRLIAWKELAGAGGGFRTLKGPPGASVTALLNDHPGMYGDNRGALTVELRYD